MKGKISLGRELGAAITRATGIQRIKSASLEVGVDQAMTCTVTFFVTAEMEKILLGGPTGSSAEPGGLTNESAS